MARSALHNAAFSMAGQLGARLLALAFIPVLARSLGPTLYGDVGLGVAIGTLLAVALEPGLNGLLIRDGARDHAALEQRLGEALGYKLTMLLLVWPLAVAAGALLGYRGTTLWAVVFAGGQVLLITLEDVFSSALVARERLDLESGLRVASKFLANGLGFIAIFALHASFVPLIAMCAAGGLLTAGVGAWLVRKAGIRVRPTLQLSALVVRLKEALPLGLAAALWLVVLRLDQVLASQLGVSRESIGDYNSAVKPVEALILFPNAVAMTFQPLISRAFLRGTQACAAELKVALESSFALTLPLAIGGSMLAFPIVGVIYGDRFAGAGPLLATQLLVLPLTGIQFCAIHGLTAVGRLRAPTAIWVINLAVNVATNLVLIPRIGVLGCSLSAIAGGIASAIAAEVLLRRAGLTVSLLGAAWRPAVAAAAMAGALALTQQHLALQRPVQLLVGVAVGGAIYLALFLGLGGMRLVTELRRARAPHPTPVLGP